MTQSNKFSAINPSNNEILEGEFQISTNEAINEAVQQATSAFSTYRKTSNASRADFLDQIATEIMNLGDELLERCNLETSLPMGRLQGERGRTVGQLQKFANVVRDGSWVDARIDHADPERTPIPKSDVRQMLTPLGAVAIFGASNFPLAFSVAGGDTASALAAGCSVVVKGHPAHPGTSQMIGNAIQAAIEKCNMPQGTFNLVQGNNVEVGQQLVMHENIKAVGFTGSFQGGKAIFDLANSRAEPIPVFAEMGSTNPVFILPEILNTKGQEIAQGLAGSITMGVGQFCTNPGMTFVENSQESEMFCDELSKNIDSSEAQTMLSPGIKKAYDNGLSTIALNAKEIASGIENEKPNIGVPKVYKTTIDQFSSNESLAEEVFGPSSLVITADDKNQILEAAKNLKGHLTATVHGTENDFENYKELFEILEQKVGRIVLNGYPTGVEVCDAMVHGGPFPATTAASTTSVGSNAIKRFARPLCFQDYPESLLPTQLQNTNPDKLVRMVDGKLMLG